MELGTVSADGASTGMQAVVQAGPNSGGIHNETAVYVVNSFGTKQGIRI